MSDQKPPAIGGVPSFRMLRCNGRAIEAAAAGFARLIARPWRETGCSDPDPMVRIGALHRPIRFGRSFRRFSPILSEACASSPLFGSRQMPTQRRSEATQKPYSKTLYQNLDLTYVVAYDRRSIRQPDFLPSGRGYDRALGSGSRNSLIGLGLGLPVTG